MSDGPPKIEGAPGLKWIKRKTGWEGRWRPRLDLVRRGYPTKSLPLWKGETLDEVPGEASERYIKDQCERMQAEMLAWSRGGLPEVPRPFSGTLESLIQCYRTDADSSYRTLRFQSQRNTDARCARLIRDHGFEEVAEIKARLVRRWHEKWTEGGKIATGHSLIAMLRTLMGFGATFLEDAECARVRGVLSGMKFKMTKPRNQQVTADQANAVRAKAHELGMSSIALAQAFQFECTLRQKDVIGEWIPQDKPGLSDVIAGNEKWMCGIRWSEIDDKMILRHTTSKRQKDVEIDLKLAPMVMEELARLPVQPTTGPVIVYEKTGRPFEAYQFRREWRLVATKAGVPASVFNMDSRSGAISEAFLAKASPDHIRQSATHSNLSTTQGYNRIATEATAEVMRTRVEHRNKK